MEVPASSKASRLNKMVMEMLEDALEENPEVDLLSVIPPSYKNQISPAERPLSEIGKLNQWTILRMERQFQKEPESDFSSTFQNFYRKEWDRRKKDLDPSTLEKMSKQEAQGIPSTPTDTLERLEDIDKATVVSPLSDTVIALLNQDINSIPLISEPDKSLAEKLKQTFRNSTKIYESPFRGAVFKCSDEIIAKVVRMSCPDTTEYTSLQYLAQHAPNFPAPKPHGLVTLGRYNVTFMSYISSMPLAKAWPSMTCHQKVSVQRQLDDIFRRLRQLKQPDGFPLGGVAMEGVKDLHRGGYRSDQVITTGAGFENWKFSLSMFSTDHYIKDLHGFLPPPATESVFTHGDLRPDNIMVDLSSSGDYSVTGIIDWEDGGFYPYYHECTKATNTLHSDEKSDWYQYLPPCVAPHTFPVWWLVDRLWDRNILYAH
ncbi:putative phosphotransferase family protein [Phaeomoniella chlamydospora]|uniref:Putative phosphotransferase family protein n=1 Tax=Phaeomoniella chlamydospora TaxID=158046 RepID=A0A0G2EM25_PHACM|nr:putative phosphotransferase family protein [Phaeomoniella chlamydospora]